MHGTKEERLAIGKLVHDGELTKREASEKCDVPERTIARWVIEYKESNGIERRIRKSPTKVRSNERTAYENMTRDELIDALILAKANELRAKKGYEVRGVGADKEFIISNEESSK